MEPKTRLGGDQIKRGFGKCCSGGRIPVQPAEGKDESGKRDDRSKSQAENLLTKMTGVTLSDKSNRSKEKGT